MERCAKHINLLSKCKKVFVIEEIWKDIKNYEGYYQISNFGRVRSLDRFIYEKSGKKQFKKGQMISICHNKRVNTYDVHLQKNHKRKCVKAHRLVADAFLYNDDPVSKTTVNHKDGNRSNNRIDNLEWMSYSENEKHAYDKLDRMVCKKGAKRRECVVTDKLSGTKIICYSIAEAARHTGISESQVRRLADGVCTNSKYEFNYC